MDQGHLSAVDIEAVERHWRDLGCVSDPIADDVDCS